MGKSSEVHQDSIIRRYEKRIRKTHRVANQTEQKLKEHQTALLHFKKELSRHVVKLQELADSGETSAQRRLADVRKKLQQVDKIVPYLGKYISVNRQAELQTVAVLKESCTVDIQKMARSPSKSNERETSAQREPVSVLRSSMKHFGKEHTDSEEAKMVESNSESPETESPETSQAAKLVEENPYASLSEVKPQMEKAKVKSNYAQLDFSRVPSPGGTLRPPSVNYAEVKIGTFGKGIIIDGAPTLVAQSTSPKIATVKEISTEPSESAGGQPLPTAGEIDSHSPPQFNAQEESSVQDTTLTPENAETLVSLGKMAATVVSNGTLESRETTSTPGKLETREESSTPGNLESREEISTPGKLETVPELSLSRTPPLSPIPHESLTSNSNEHSVAESLTLSETSPLIPTSPTQEPVKTPPAPTLSSTPSTKARSPPPKVAKKPPSQWRHSRTETSPPVNGFRDSIASDISSTSDQGLVNNADSVAEDGTSSGPSSPARKDATSVLTNAPSVLDRIKVTWSYYYYV